MDYANVATEELDVLVSQLNISREDAIKRLFELLYEPLIYFAFQYNKQLELSEEIVADSFVKLWERRTDFSTFQQIRSFLYTCTKHAALNTLRQQKVRFMVAQVEDLEGLLMDDTDLLDKMIKTELISQLHQRLETLPEAQRTVFRLSFFEDLTSQEISERLNMSLKAVYTNRSRAIYMLKRKMSLDCLLLFFLLDTLRHF